MQIQIDRSKQLPVNIHYINKRTIYEVTEDIYIRGIKIPKGFLSDGHSVPWIVRWLVSNHSLPIIAAIYHDYAYIYNPRKNTRKEVDDNYHSIMRKDYRATWYESGIAWLGVRMGSWYYWNKYRKH